MTRTMSVTAAAVLVAAVVCGANAWNVGASSRTILPTVNGSAFFWTPVPDTDATSPGTLVLQWDFGRISVGNGATQSHWVRDDIRTSAAAIEDDQGTITVFSTTEVYMLFAPDLAEYEQLVRERVGEPTASRLRFFSHGQHNHEGPDTSGLGGPVNREYIEYMFEQMATAAVEAIYSRVPADITFGQAPYTFGVGDGRDPRVWDRNVRIVRARPLGQPTATPIATIVLWSMHPEVTLGFSPTVPAADCEALGEAPGCSARGQFFTGDFPGVFARELKNLQGGGQVLYFNSGIGSQIGPRGPVWEVSDACPITGDGSVLPPGCTTIPGSFRKAFLIGQQLALAVHNTPTTGAVPTGVFDYRESYSYSRLTNLLFKVGLCPAFVRPEGFPLVLGYNLRELYVCNGAPSDATCVLDDFRCDETTLPQRVGEYARIVVQFLQMGPVRFITMPGEFSPEMVIGVPTDFDTPEGVAKYFQRADVHLTGADFTLPGTIFEMANCSAAQPCFALGLTGDEMGYVLPISDFWLTCLGTEAECTEDFQKGAMAFNVAMSGSDCEIIIQDIPAAEARYTDLYGAATAGRVIQACQYGQLQQATDGAQHYEETLSGGWRGADDYFVALSGLLGVPPTGRYQRPE